MKPLHFLRTVFPFCSYYTVTCAEISKDHTGGSLSTFFFAWGGAGAVTPLFSRSPCGVKLWPPLSGPRGSPALLDLSFLALLSGSLLQPQPCTNQTAHLGPSFSTGLGPNNGAYFTFTSSTIGACVFSWPMVPTTNFIKSLPTGTAHYPLPTDLPLLPLPKTE